MPGSFIYGESSARCLDDAIIPVVSHKEQARLPRQRVQKGLRVRRAYDLHLLFAANLHQNFREANLRLRMKARLECTYVEAEAASLGESRG